MNMSNINEAMNWLAAQEKTIFIGQNCKYPPTFILCKSLAEVPREKIIEFPVAENMQMGFSIGKALAGDTVITCYPRHDFLVLAMDQLRNHLNCYKYLWKGKFFPRIIIRSLVGNSTPLYPGEQHVLNATDALRIMCPNIKIIEITKSDDPLMKYQEAYRISAEQPVLTVELP